MKIYKFISTVKAKSADGKKPTHYLAAKENQGDKDSELVASLWSKEWKGENGEIKKFLSGEMKNQWTDHTDPSKSRKGFVIVEELELNKLLREVGEPAEEQDIPPEDEPF